MKEYKGRNETTSKTRSFREETRCFRLEASEKKRNFREKEREALERVKF